MAENKGYLDTCLVSALVKNDSDASEIGALDQLLAWHESGKIVLACSPVVEVELARIPPDFRGRHLSLLTRFRSLPKSDVGGLTRLGPAGVPMANPRHRLWRSLREALPDEQDAWHVFVASCNRFRYLITVDRRTRLSRKEAVLNTSGVHLVLPTEFRSLQHAR